MCEHQKNQDLDLLQQRSVSNGCSEGEVKEAEEKSEEEDSDSGGVSASEYMQKSPNFLYGYMYCGGLKLKQLEMMLFFP